VRYGDSSFFLRLILSEKRIIASSNGSPSMLGEAHYKRSNRRQQHAQERTEWRLALSGAD